MGFEPLREVEGNPFLKENKIATPARVTSFQSTGGKKNPTIEPNYISGDTGMGKQADERDPNLDTHVPNSYNLS